jgi:hypothetical protein
MTGRQVRSTYSNIMKMPRCTDKKCGDVTMFERWHPFHADKEVRACMSCGTRYLFDARGNDDTNLSRKNRERQHKKHR